MKMLNLKLLIADDEPAIRNGLCKAINWSDYNIDLVGQAENGMVALRMIEQYHPDIVITDIKMPKLDGLELIKSVKEKGFDTHFIIVSGFDDFAFAKKAIQFGVHNYLLKPIKKQELIDTILSLQDKLEKGQTASLDYINEATKSIFSNKFFTDKNYKNFCDALHLKFPLCVVLFDGDFSPIEAVNLLSHTCPMDSTHVFASDNHAGILLYKSQSTFLSQDKPNQFCENIRNILCNTFDTTVYCSIGNMVTEAKFIYLSYRSAINYLSYRMYETPMRLFDKSIVSADSECPIQVDNHYSEKLVVAILDHDIENIALIVSDFMDWILYIPTPSPNFVLGMCTHLMIEITKKLAIYDVLKNVLPQSNIYEEIARQNSITILHEWMTETLTDFAFLLDTSLLESSNPLIEDALDYINKHITSKISLEDVAGYVHLSKNYFTSLFRKVTGESFRDYILNSKIEYAKKQLQESEISVSNLAALLGYEESRSFNRAFKNSTGKSPSGYSRLFHQQL